MTFAMKDFRRIVKEWMLCELQPHGFRSRGNEVYRKIPGGTQTFCYGTVDRLPLYVQIAFFLQIQLDQVARLAVELNELPSNASAIVSVALRDIEPALISRESTHQGTEIHTLIELEEHLNHLVPTMRNKVIPILDRVQNVGEVAKLVPITAKSMVPPYSQEHFARLFAIVYLSGGDWERLVKEAGAQLEELLPDWNSGHVMRPMWDTVVRNLRKLPPRPKE